MVCAPVRSIIPSLQLVDYLSIQAHKPCSISHILGTSAFKSCFDWSHDRKEHHKELCYNRSNSVMMLAMQDPSNHLSAKFLQAFGAIAT